MGLLKEFKDFAMRGNVIDLAVGVIMGAAFSPIITSLVEDVIMPPIAAVMGKADFSGLAVELPIEGEKGGAAKILYGKMIQAIFKFLVTAAAMFMLIKVMNAVMKPAPASAAPPPPTPTESLLKEIRDLMAKR